jgi:hypothetical protein
MNDEMNLYYEMLMTFQKMSTVFDANTMVLKQEPNCMNYTRFKRKWNKMFVKTLCEMLLCININHTS